MRTQRHVRTGSLRSHLPEATSALRALVEPLESRVLLAVNPIVLENQQPGTPWTEWTIQGAGDMTIQGYATDISVNHGQTVYFKIDDQAQVPYRLDIYRMGYYGGIGARRVATMNSSPNLQIAQPAGLYDATTGLLDCGNWTVTNSWEVPADAVSGIYFAKVTRLDTGGGSHIVFIVRDDERHSELLFQTSDTTWQAYNAYGGRSLYANQSPGGQATKVSYNRPFTDRAYDGINSFVFTNEYPMVQWLEKNGYDVSYFTGVDSARLGSEILEHKTFLSVGHDEYWSGQMRANVEAARDAGVNLAFFSANEGFWKVRWEESVDGTGTPYRTMVCYKESYNGAKTDPMADVWTGNWRDPRFSPPADGGYPENALSGTIFMVNATRNDPIYVPAEDGKLRFWRNTDIANLAPNAVATLPAGVLGYEWDVDLDNGFRPAGLIDMSHTTIAVDSLVASYNATYGPGTATHSLTMYRAPSGALVFGAGTVQWSWGLSSDHDKAGPAADVRMQQATVNLLADMGIQPVTLQPDLVPAVASTDHLAPTSTITWPSAGAVVQGGSTVTITGTASDGGGGVVGGVEVSVDGGRTWHPAVGRNTWQYTWRVRTSGTVTVLSRATDDSLNMEVPSAGVAVSVQGPLTTSLWNDGTIPFQPGIVDKQVASKGGIELGMKFHADADGEILGVRFYRYLQNTGVHVGSLWSSSGQLLARLTFTGETQSGWQEARFGAPVAIQAGQTYIVSYHSTTDYYACDAYFFSGHGVDNGALHAPADGQVGGQGVYLYGPGGFPNQAYHAENYYVDVLFASKVVPPAVVSQSPVPDLKAVPVNSAVTVSFSEPIDPATVLLSVKDAAGTSVAGTLSYDAGTQRVIFQPTAPLAGQTTYRVSVSGAADLDGNVMTAPVSWSFTAVLADHAAPTVVNLSPAVNGSDVAPSSAISVSFNEAINPESVLLSVKDAAGTSVAGTLSYEAGSHTVSFQPISLLATQTTYTVTVSAADLAGNVMPAPVSWSFTTTAPDVVPPTVTACVPGVGATGVALNSAIGVTFNEAIDPASAVLEVRDGGGATVAGTLSYNASTRTLSFQPAVLLSPQAVYTVSVSAAADLAGNVMTAPVSWSFNTAATLTTISIWNPTTAVAASAVSDPETISSGGVELGTKFRADVSGEVLAIRFYKGVGSIGVHTGHLWSGSGQLLASVTFSDETASDWQEAYLSIPVTIQAGQTYVVSYHTTMDGWMRSVGYFSTETVNGPLHALQSGADGGNGVYRYGSSGFPANSFSSSNYWVDVLFAPSTASDVTPPAPASQSPAPNATGVALSSAISVTFSEAIDATNVVLSMKDAAGNSIDGTLSYHAATWTLVFQPAAPLAVQSTYSVTISGAVDLAGNMMLGAVSWSFSTTGDTTAPTVSAWSPVSDATEVALNSAVSVSFNEAISLASVLLSVRDAGGTAVAGTLSYDAATDTVTFQPGSPLDSQTTYTVTVSAAADLAGNALAAPVSWSFTTVLVDSTAPKVTARSPSPSASGVPLGTAVTVTFSEAIDPTSTVLTLSDPAGALVAGVLSYNSAAHAVTFQPAAALAAQTIYTVSVSGATDLAGNVMTAPVTWSFTTTTALATASVWSTTVTPSGAAIGDAQTISAGGVELGMRFWSEVGGQVLGVRFYKGNRNTGSHIGNLWDANGDLLATATFVNESTQGWQEVYFGSPVTIQAGQVYVVSYHTTTDRWVRNLNYFTAETSSGPLHALQSGTGGGNGVYRYGSSSGFPTNSWMASNYWVDVLFASGTGSDTTPPTVAIDQAADQADPTTAASVQFRVVFSEAVTGFTASDVVLSGSAGATTVELVETGALDGTTYLVTVSGMQRQGTVIATIPAGAATGTTGLPSEASTSTDDSVYFDVLPTVSGFQVNDGASQRAMVNQLTLSFSEPVTLADALHLQLHGGAGVANVVLGITNPLGDGMTYVVRFSGSAVIGGSLPDGVYDLVLTGAAAVDGTGNGVVGNSTWTFHRLFGDADGNRVVNALDYAKLKATYGRSSTDPLYNSALDYENNGVINALDLAQFRKRYGLLYSY